MKNETLKNRWGELQIRARERWGRLTDADLASIAGDADALTARIERYYGRTHAQAVTDVDEWLSIEAVP